MKAIISTTYSDNYLFFLPITTWAWNKLGVDVICFAPKPLYSDYIKVETKQDLVSRVLRKMNMDAKIEFINCKSEKEATYMQCSRLYAGALTDIPDDEILVTSDIDMIMFRIPQMVNNGFSIFGADLTPPKQYPMCFISGQKSDWESAFKTTGKTVQQCLDELLGGVESSSMRSDYWAKDQEHCFNMISEYGNYTLLNRTNGQNQFATHRLDRDDSYILDRLNLDIYDYHANRPGYEESNFAKILTIMKYYYPEESFDWMVEYRNSYVNLL